MPDFTIRGNPGAIRARAVTMVDKGQQFYAVGDALAKCSTEGWTGRAADHFREAHDLEPDRWTQAGNGFVRAGNALSVFAGEVEVAQSVAEWAEQEYARGDQVSADARSAYDADVAAGREQQSNYLAQGLAFTLTIAPFDDPGEAIRQNAVTRFEGARADLDAAAHACAGEVKAGCADAPEEPNWLESGLRFVAGVWEGAGEAVWDLLTLSPVGLVNMVQDSWKLAHGDLTPEELAAKYRLSLESAQGIWQSLQDDPVEFGKQMGKGLLDWDTWADDPARAWGHLVPDAIAAAATGGAGGAASRGLGSLDDIADGLTAVNRMDDAAGLGRLDEAASLDRFAGDDLAGFGDDANIDVTSIDDVRTWLDDINHGPEVDPFDPERSVNCGQCALAVHERFEGSVDATADLGTLSVREMEEATGRIQVSMSPTEIAEHLRNEGAGSHAVVGVDRDGAAGHWFNAYFDGEKVYAVDGQTGEILDWPPDMSYPDAPVTNWDVGVKK